MSSAAGWVRAGWSRVRHRTARMSGPSRLGLLRSGLFVRDDAAIAAVLLDKAMELLELFEQGPSYRLVGLTAYDLFGEAEGIQLELPVDETT